MPKVKNHIIQKKKDYFYVAVGIGISVFCILLIGRVGVAGSILALFFSFIFGDFSTIILGIALVYSIIFIIFKKKIDFHHISFVGSVFIFLALLMFAHLGLYDSLDMTNTTIISKTLALYRHYLRSYNISYSCGGGIIAALILQVTCLLVGKIGSIILGIAFVLIGISYFANINIFSLLRGGKFSQIPKQFYVALKKYVSNLHFPSSEAKPVKKVSLNSLEDTETQVNFTLQNEINKEKFETFKKFIRDKKIYSMVESYYTSYSSSRFVIRMPNYKEDDLKEILGFFNRQVFVIKNQNDYYLDYPNQFRKLLTLKNILVSENNDYKIPLALDVDGSKIDFDISIGRLLVLVGDRSSGIKTLLRSLVTSILIKNITCSDIYFYDFENEFRSLDNSNIKYVNNEKSAEIALDEAFNEYERRSEVLKYFNCDSVKEVNAAIKKANLDIAPLYPELHILYFDIALVSQNLLQKIIYVVRFSIKVGITIIVVARSKNELSKLELNKADIVAFNMADVSTSLKLFGSDMACRLQKKGDVIIRKDNNLYHGQTPYVSTNDFEKLVI